MGACVDAGGVRLSCSSAVANYIVIKTLSLVEIQPGSYSFELQNILAGLLAKRLTRKCFGDANGSFPKQGDPNTDASIL